MFYSGPSPDCAGCTLLQLQIIRNLESRRLIPATMGDWCWIVGNGLEAGASVVIPKSATTLRRVSEADFGI
jgi:hypothetical protein